MVQGLLREEGGARPVAVANGEGGAVISTLDIFLTLLTVVLGSASGALLMPRKYVDSINRGLGLRFPRFWSATITATVAFPWILGVPDANTGGSWFPWVLIEVVIAVGWLVAFVVRGRLATAPDTRR